VAGDVLDLAALASGYTEDNPKKDNLAIAIGSVAGITLLDIWCAKRMHSGRPHGTMSTHRQYVAEGPSPRLPSGEFPARSR